MNITQVSRLLNDNNIPTILSETSLKEERDQGENYETLRLNNNKWELLFISERNDEEKVQKTFDTEEDASKYYYLSQLKTYFLYNYIIDFEYDNEDINIGDLDFSFDNLTEALRRLNVDEVYYSLNGKVKEHSIFLEPINENESKVKFIGEDKKEVMSTIVLKNWKAYNYVFSRIYYLYLMNEKCKELLSKGEIKEKFSDADYVVVLS